MAESGKSNKKKTAKKNNVDKKTQITRAKETKKETHITKAKPIVKLDKPIFVTQNTKKDGSIEHRFCPLRNDHILCSENR